MYTMKLKSFIAVAVMAGLFTACGEPYQATTTTTVEVAPSLTRSAFVAQYPSASSVVWSRYDATMVPIDWELAGWPNIDNDAYLVRFNMDNNNYYAWYDASGNWIGTSYSLSDYNSLPVAVNTTVTSRYPGYTITAVQREFQRDRVAYEIEMKNNDTKRKVLIDAYGNVIKEKSRSLD
jgi:uncharacterized membrane protein YkoI